MDTNDLRKASIAVFLATDEAVAKDLSNKLKWAANEIDRLCKHIAVLTSAIHSGGDKPGQFNVKLKTSEKGVF